MEKSEEVRLIQLALEGDRGASATLIRTHQQSLYAYMLRLSGNHDIAEDIVQDAFVRVLTNLHRFDTKFRFSTWLFTIAKRLYVNAMQKHKPHYDTAIVDAKGERTSHDPSLPSMTRESELGARGAIERALMELSLEQREILVLFHQLDWPIARISDHLGMPEGTVKSHLHRGRKRMRRYFELHESEELNARFAEIYA